MIVEPDADLAKIAAKVKVAGFSHAGQSCISVQRVIVHRSVHEQMLEHLRREAESIVVGDPADDATDLGPLIKPTEADRVKQWVDEAVAGGGKLITGGSVTEKGIMQPTIVDGAPQDSKLCVSEVFGPVIITVAYDDFDEALDIANDTEFGLHVGVFTNDLPKALKAARKLEFGGVLINEVPTFRADQQPYGGVRESGNTREGPAYAVLEMTEPRFVSLQ